jgi:MFS family permease
MPDVTPKPIRSKGNVVINIMGVLGGVTFLLLMFIPSLYSVERDANGNATNIIGSNWGMIGTVCAIMIVCAFIIMLAVKEKKLVAKKEEIEKAAGIYEAEIPIQVSEKATLSERIKNNFAHLDASQKRSLVFLLTSVFLWFFGYNAAKTWFSTASYELFGSGDFKTPLLIANVAGFIMYIPSSLIADKIGRKNTVITGLVIMLIGFILGSVFVFTVKNASLFTSLFTLVFIFVGAGWATLNVHSYVMSVEMANKSNTGFFTGLYYVSSMSSQGITSIISGLVLERFKMPALFPYVVFFVVLAIITMMFVQHGNAKKIPAA